LGLGLLLLLSACSVLSDSGFYIGSGYDSNGQKIYFTGINQSGEQIDYLGGGSSGGMMMNQNLSCASCHGDDGRGGLHFMHMTVMDSPSLRDFSSEPAQDGHEESNNHLDEHALEHSAYSIEDFVKAVVFGTHPNGDSLNGDMPRWYMGEDDLMDLYKFIINWE
ncbi:MAG: hypothetical protein OEV06_10560, partial [Anaerolineae bacterium]|nr:hypothetical protein [Anaerolineae bacterium]